MLDYEKVYSKEHPDVFIKDMSGHFVTPSSHINHFFDMTTTRSRRSEARDVAKALARDYMSSQIVDTIVCLEGTDVIGAYLADELTDAGIMSMNQHRTIYVAKPEYDTYGQIIFRDNMQIMIKDKYVLVLLALTSTGKTLGHAINSIKYYGGIIAGVSAIFSAANKIGQYEIHHLFSKADIPEFASYAADDCPMCKQGMKITAMCNGFGYSEMP